MIGLLIIPCYNEEAIIEKSIHQISSHLNSIPHNIDILIVDDGSKDRTVKLARECQNLYGETIKLISLERNSGHQAAVLAGIEYSVEHMYDFSISIDCDLQDDLYVIDKMINMSNKYSIIAGCHNDRRNDTIWKMLTADLFYKTANLLGISLLPHHADFRLLSRKAGISLLELNQERLFLRGQIMNLGYKIKCINYERKIGLSGSRPSKYTLRKMLSLAANGILLNTILPLRLITISSLLIFSAFLVYSIFLLVAIGFSSDFVRGWPSITLILTGSFSAVFLSLGIIAEYIGRLYRVKTKNFYYQIK